MYSQGRNCTLYLNRTTTLLVPDLHRNISTVPDYTFTFEFEDSFELDGLKKWLFDYHQLSLYLASAYLALVFCGQAYMKDKKPFKLRKSLVVWNLFLSAFSIFGALRCLPELYYTVSNFGFKTSLCSGSYFNDNPVAALWTWLFMVSKAFELLDTVFVVLRKQKLMLLHWFHHSTVLVWTWFLGQDHVAMGRWFMTVNYTVHAFMYSYYALRALGVRVPKPIAICITASQILQMLVGFYVSIRGFEAWLSGEDCLITGRIATLSLTLYSFYFVLFVNFFYHAYIRPVLIRMMTNKGKKE